MLEWARDFDPAASIVQPVVTDGEAILFDGRIWHGSNNRRAEGQRIALILRYVRGDVPVYRPDFSQLEWPFRYLDDPRPPVLVVSGNADPAANRLVEPPSASPPNWKTITTEARSLPLPLFGTRQSAWQSHFLFNGVTETLGHLTCHASVLEPGACPHPPHAHLEEEILIVLDGEAEIVLAGSPDDPSARLDRLKAGGLVYHPAFQHHTIRNMGKAPVTYLMLKWRASPLDTATPLGSVVRRPRDYPASGSRPFEAHTLFEGPTAFLRKLHCHLSKVQPGAGYEPHTDPYDVAILLLRGKIVTADVKLTAPAIAYFGRGELHGLRNAGKKAARYLVFEFHGSDHDESLDEPAAVTAQTKAPAKAIGRSNEEARDRGAVRMRKASRQGRVWRRLFRWPSR